MQSSLPLRVCFAVSACLALFGMDQGPLWLGATFKTATTLLLFPILGFPRTPLSRRVAWGLLFSLVGDVALLVKSKPTFQLGLASFLVAHLLYISAFRPFALWSLQSLGRAAAVLAATALTLTLAYPEAAVQHVAIPILVYGAVLTSMLSVLSATLGGTLPQAERAAFGALLFYVADTAIAFERFVPSVSLPHPVLLTTGVYWLGQYLIVTSASDAAVPS